MKNHRYWLALSRLPGIGPVTVRRWLDYFLTVDKLFSASTTDWQTAGLTAKHIDLLKSIRWNIIDNDLVWLEKNNGQMLSLDDPDYPPLLLEIHDPPLVLYLQGDKTVLMQQQLAMVGSRHPTPFGQTLAFQFAKELASNGLVITSGLALGIDAASHKGVLAAKGKTIAVLGTGLKTIYPRSHEKLAKDIIDEGGTIVSEFPLDMPPKAKHFPLRNRVISGLSLGVLVVEAAIRSGSLITARMALEQNREVFAIPGSIHNPLARGCHQLIRQGAKLVEESKDILDEIRPLKKEINCAPPVLEKSEPVDLPPPVRRVLAQIGYEVTALDVIIMRSQLTAAEVSSMLLPLELEGYVRVVPGGYIRA
ncbi:MAG TPA: DNA-processing protein DprA [Gammaproteobacteria bacterium]|nr:DNA-processing protein DprA [Gammaproteobacteria bacterium]